MHGVSLFGGWTNVTAGAHMLLYSSFDFSDILLKQTNPGLMLDTSVMYEAKMSVMRQSAQPQSARSAA